MVDKASIRVLVYGHVQGVYFRNFTSQKAGESGLYGYVRNLPDGKTVEVYAEGEKTRLEKLISHLKIGPPGAAVEKITVSRGDFSGSYNSFDIKH
jgi:acylphosphatase